MPNRPGYVNIIVPWELRDRLSGHRAHPRQPLHELLSLALDFWESRAPLPNGHASLGMANVEVATVGSSLPSP